MSQRSQHNSRFIDDIKFPSKFNSESEIDDFLSLPSRALTDSMARISGDLIVLGAGGKMGPTLARLARNAMSPERRVIAVSRFSDNRARSTFEEYGIETIKCDLDNSAEISMLPKCDNVVFMAGRKFGSDGNNPATWAMNVYVPALVAQTFKNSRIAIFSTACVYPFAPVSGQGADEKTQLNPPGEYANSCVGRERLFEYFSSLNNTPGRLIRLSYAIELRYGVLVDVALKVWQGKPIDVTMGHVNCIWQGDANAQALRCLAECTTPVSPINVSGPENISIRWLAEEFAIRFNKSANINGSEAPTAWLVNTAESARLFDYPKVTLKQQIEWIADWIANERPLYGKPTKFELRDGNY